jgi:cell division protein FtsI (penicillin-binding protein 3)
MVKIINGHYKDNPKQFVKTLKSMSVGKKLGLTIKGEGNPKIPSPDDKDWNGLSLPWMAYGYGVSFTPLQMLTFYNAIANNGEMVKPQFIKEIRTQNNTVTTFEKEVINPKICSQETINKVKEMMKNVVKRGTAANIYDKNFSMAGKTGTCQTEYWKEGGPNYVASFAGFFPADDPEYSCIVVIHKPNKKIGYYGNIVAAPVFKKIANKIYSETPVQEELILEGNLTQIDTEYKSFYKKINKHYQKIPDLKNMSGMDAIPLLENMGLKVNAVGVGKVRTQSIKPGEKVKKGSIISISMS